MWCCRRDVSACQQSCHVAMARSICQHSLNTMREMPSIQKSVVQTMLTDAQEWDPNVLIPDVLREDGGSGLAERMDRAVGAVRRARTRSADHNKLVGQLELVSDAESSKAEGNEHFRSGHIAEAVASYNRAVDTLHAVPSTDGSSSTLPPHVQVLLATSLSNRAQCYLLLAEPTTSITTPPASEPRVLARNAANDCAYGLELRELVPRRIVEKLEARARAAHRILATHTSETPPAEPGAPEPEPEPQAPPAEITHACAVCGTEKPRASYTKNQWKKRKFDTAKCKDCVVSQPATATERPLTEPAAEQTSEAAVGSDTPGGDTLHDVLGELGLLEHADLLKKWKCDLHACASCTREDWDEMGVPAAAGHALQQAAAVVMGYAQEVMQPEPEPMTLPAVVLGRQVPSIAEHGGSECPMCLEEWQSELVDKNVVVLPCFHACCQAVSKR